MDSLKAVISSTLDATECTFYDQDAFDNAVDELAAAVRSFMGSEEAVERVARALAGPRADDLVQAGNALGEPCDYPAWMLHQLDARAALSAAIGEDIGGGRG